MYCPNCGFKNEENVNFCASCGNKIAATRNQYNATYSAPKRKLSKKWLYTILASVISVALIITTVIFIIPGSVEDQLKNNVWWTKVNVSSEAHEYDSQYTVLISCERYIFCPAGTVRNERFDMGWGAYYSSYKVTEDNVPSYYEFQEGDSYGSGGTWELLEDNVLLFEDKYYEWDKIKADDTWYLDGDTLRIGDLKLSTTKPKNKLSEDAERPPYWCSNCGEDGPYDIYCPECDSKEKTKCDW